MDNKVISIYKVPILLSVVLAVVLLALETITQPLSIVLVFLGSLLGLLSLDIEYIIYAYFLEPGKDFSINVVAYIKHKDYKNLLQYIHLNKDEIKDKSIHSALFQIAYAIFTVFAVSSTNSYFINSLILSIYANLLYRSLEAFYDKKIDSWFWALKNKPERSQIVLYLIGLFVVFVYCLTLF